MSVDPYTLVIDGVPVEELTERGPEVARPITDRDVLLRAADLLEEFGWCQKITATDKNGTAVDVSGATQFCLYGAVLRAHLDLGGKGYDDSAGWDDLWNRISDQIPTPINWNDAAGRTKAEVVARLREAAERVA